MDREVVSGIPMNGKTFEARVHKISNSGNGIVETTKSEINLGPVNSSAVGEQIEAMKLPGAFARIKRSKRILKSNYIKELQNMTPYSFSIDYGDAHHNISKNGLRNQENMGGILEYIPEGDDSPDDSRNESISNEQNHTKEDPLYYRPIKRIDEYGNGIVEINDELISIGPVRENVVGYEAAVIPIGDGVAVCKTLSVRKENYFKNHISGIDSNLIDTLNHFEVGMTVRDRQEEFIQDAIVVNLPPIPAKDYILYHDGQEEVTVEDENPEYDRLVSVVVVVSAETLQEHFSEYDGGTIPLKELSEQGIEHYVYPPERLRPREDGIPDYDGLKSVSKINTRSFSESVTEISPSESDEVLADEDSQYKYKTDQSHSRRVPSTESGGNDTQKEKIDPSSLDTETVKEPTNNNKQTHPQKKDEADRPSEGVNIESFESEIEESTVNPDEILTEETSEDHIKEDATEDPQSELNLDELRENAKEDEVEEVSQTASTASETTQYHRSTSIKEYVKARADGNCEGCGEPAPFTSTTGDPYLHAHHLHELSDGGSDTVDTVIALCPNCHYRIHHGEDGENYNQKLLDKVQNLETN